MAMTEQRQGAPKGLEGFLVQLDQGGVTRLTVIPEGRYVHRIMTRILFEVPDLELATKYRAGFAHGKTTSYKDVYSRLKGGRPDYVYAHGTYTPVSENQLDKTEDAYFQDLAARLVQLSGRFPQAELFVDAKGLGPNGPSRLGLKGEPEQGKLYKLVGLDA